MAPYSVISPWMHFSSHPPSVQEYTVNRNKKILKKRQDLLDQSETHEKSDPFIGKIAAASSLNNNDINIDDNML